MYLIPLFVSDAQVQTEQCSFCLLLVKTLENLLPKERTEVNHIATASANRQLQRGLTVFCVLHQGAVIDLLEEVCNILPSSYRSQCQALVGRFSKKVLDAILSYATPHAICALLQMCKGQEGPPLGPEMNKRLTNRAHGFKNNLTNL